MRLSDAGLRQRPTKLLYPNHRLPPWLIEDATPRSLEPIVRRSRRGGHYMIMGPTPSTKRAPNTNPRKYGIVRRDGRISGKMKKAKVAARKLPTTTAANTQPDMTAQEAGW